MMLEIKDVCFGYPNNLVLDRINLVIHENDHVILKGDNGTGKTTLLNLIAGTLMPSAGDILFNGQSVKSHPDYERTFIGRIFQESQQHIVPELSVGEFLCLAQAESYSIFRPVKKLTRIAQIWNVLQKNGILWHIQEIKRELEEQLGKEAHEHVTFEPSLLNLPFWEKPLNEFSGGEQQILSMIFQFLRKPSPFLILADEPTANLDADNRKTSIDLLKTLSEHCAVLIVSHDPDLQGNRNLFTKNRNVLEQ